MVAQKSYANWKLHETKVGCCYPFVTKNPGWKDTRAYNSPDEAMFSPEDLDSIQLPYILSSFRKSRNATDPRDRVYGMLGLARSEYENAVVADYTQSVEMAFKTAVVQMVSKTGSLEVLSHVVPGLRSPMTVPSYVPDWTSSYKDLHAHFSWLKWLKDKNEYNACKSTASDLTTFDPGHIQLKGIEVDEVEMVSSPLGPALTPGSLDPLLSLVKRYNERNHDGHQISDTVFWSTICESHGANRFQKSNRRSSWPKGPDPAPFERLKAWYSKPAAEFIDDHLHDKDLRIFADLYQALRTGRKFEITRTGRLAWCSDFCQEGDKIVIFASGKVPFVLRELGRGNHQFLGDAYVYGIMDGEAIDGLMTGSRAWENFGLV
ncbi:hypothetical protein N0V86_004077 [Didymella sp. IMI 355093]|nr:hypothetical protein N0V86_004077 [Didymella sp. IMI 355093]